MAEEQNTAEFVERVEVAPAGGENVEDPTKTGEALAEGEAAPSEEGDTGDGAPEGGRQERMVIRQPKEAVGDDEKKEGAPAAVEGETPKERALRFEIEGLRTKLKGERSAELREGVQPVAPAKKELSPEKAAILAKYKPNEIESLKEVLPLLAEDMGFVRAEELSKQQYETKADDVIQKWVDEHPEYSDEALWGQVKQTFQKFYKPPQNPTDYRTILNRIHQDIFNIKPTGDKGGIIAQQQKIKVASAPGASGPSRTTPQRSNTNASGLRLDALRGFEDEEIESIKNRAAA